MSFATQQQNIINIHMGSDVVRISVLLNKAGLQTDKAAQAYKAPCAYHVK